MTLLSKNLRSLALAIAVVGAVGLPSTLPAAASVQSLHGVIKGDALWKNYKTRFMKRDGRIIDNANGNISHSEGQGFAMLMAIAADDRRAFDTIWTFTKQRLGVRRDHLFAWKWRPGLFGNVKDKNNATDGDILVAWALLEAAEAGYGDHYRSSALNTLHDVKKLIKPHNVFGAYILPAKFGFSAEHHRGKSIINLSYWVYPAFDRIAALTGDRIWNRLSESGNSILMQASRNRAGLPADWNTISRNKRSIGTSHKFKANFSYNAIRVPLYLAWSGAQNNVRLNDFSRNWLSRGRTLKQVNTRFNTSRKKFDGIGYYAVAAVINCSLSGSAFPTSLRQNLDKKYYPASLQMLSIIATKQRYPQCW